MESFGNQTLSVALVHFPLFVLGPGARIGIWLAGCPKRCAGCIAPEWQHEENGSITTTDQLVEQLRPFFSEADGVTISGGEPFAKPLALLALLRKLRLDGIKDILIYSGYTVEELHEHAPEALSLLDALIDGRFNHELPSEDHWRGSSNQRLHILTQDTDLAQRYRNFSNYKPVRRMLQSVIKPDKIIIIGIPEKTTDIEELRNGTL